MRSRTWRMTVTIIGLAGLTAAAAAAPLTVTLDDLQADGSLPDAAGFCRPDPATTIAPGTNRSLGVRWSPGPQGTRAYALVMTDSDVPRDLSSLNRAGTHLAVDAQRMPFTHWVLVDIPATTTALPAGADGEGRPQGGKPLGITPHGVRGQNGYAGFFRDGPYGGYDGPCPPWNDLRPHGYVVRIYALDVPSLGLSGPFTQADVEKAVAGHVLATGEAGAIYTLNPDLRR